MRTIVLDAKGEPLILLNEETKEAFEIGEPAPVSPWERRPGPFRWLLSPIEDPNTPLFDRNTPALPWEDDVPTIFLPLAKPQHLPVPEIIRPESMIVPVHSLGSLVERELHEMRSRAMHRLGADVPVDEVKRRRREEALRRLQDPPPPPPSVADDIRIMIDGLRRRPVM